MLAAARPGAAAAARCSPTACCATCWPGDCRSPTATAPRCAPPLVEGLAPYFDEHGELQAQLLGQLIGLDFSASPRVADGGKEPRSLRDRALVAFDAMLRAPGGRDAVGGGDALDDLHWADDGSLDWLAPAERCGDLPVLLVMAGGPACSSGGPAGATARRGTPIAAEPLTPASARSSPRPCCIACRRSRRPARAPREQAEGNPFYVEELVKMLIDDGVIAGRGRALACGARRAAERRPHARHPDRRAAGAARRADRRRTPRGAAASVIGPVFWEDALRASTRWRRRCWRALQQKALVQARPESAFDGTRERHSSTTCCTR